MDDVLLAYEACSTEASVIMTTWHVNQSLDDALHFFLTTCWAAEDYFDAAGSSLAITVEDEVLAQQVHAALADPRELIARLFGGDDDAGS